MNILVRKLLDKNPLKRPSCAQILEFEMFQKIAVLELGENVQNETKLYKTI